ncbi:MAG: DNA mismatch repair protein MutS [Candidatus Omnitrophica bacterium]|nr:DNA mismatch repair protein MutS [Candidatus Omnitrophota bacterium]
MQEQYTDLTPMMMQYLQIKRENPGTILFFRLGDFYEMFFEDAKIAAGILGLALTARDAGRDNRVPMCGIPYHAAESYISRLLGHGHKVAICEQVEDPKLAKGIVRREVVRVITPGTLLGQNSLAQPQNTYLAAFCRQAADAYGLAVVDLSTGEFRLTVLSSEDRLLSELTRAQPAEVLIPSGWRKDPFLERLRQRLAVVFSEADDWTFDQATAYETLIAHFKTKNLRGFGCEDLPAAVCAAGAALRYLQQTQKTELVHMNALRPYAVNNFLVLDATAQRNLELIRTMRGEKKGSLLQELDFTQTAMGSRLLVQWLQQPLLDTARINERLDGVAELHAQQPLRRRLRETMKEIVDIERLLSRISLDIANARDVFNLNQSLKIVPAVQAELAGAASGLLVQARDGLAGLQELSAFIDRAIRQDAPLSVREGRMIRPGFDAELDQLLEITQGGKEWLAALQEQEIKRTGISSLKIKYNRVFGYYIEITKANLHLTPPDYIRKQTLANAERFITPQLKEQEEKILNAEERIAELEFSLFQKVRQRILAHLNEIQRNASLLARLDVLNSLAEAAGRNRYVRPSVTDDLRLQIIEGRHPVVENLLPPGKFIPNDTVLDCAQEQVAIITGPNMAGKSTYIRQVALIVLMAQMGGFVPAKSAQIGVVDRIFTRVGAADDITMGMSTFMMEMSETANILHNATQRSIIILDEIGRGTSTFDGLSIAWATAEYLHRDGGPKPKTLFATHYHELAELELTCAGIKNYNVAVREWNDEVLFLYKLARGAADHSYGIHVGRLAGLPRQVIVRAREILSNLEINSLSADGIPSLVKSDQRPHAAAARQPELFCAPENPVLADLRSVDINRLTPLEALNRLQQWRDQLAARPE